MKLRSDYRHVAIALLAAALSLATTQATAQATTPSAIPAKTFFANNDIGAARLSPSGRYLALTVPATSGRAVLAVVAVDSDKPPVVVASASWADIASFEWVNDDRLVYNVIDLQSALRAQGFGPGLYSVRRDGSEARQLIRSRWDEFTTGTNIASNVLSPAHALLSIPRNGGTDVIVGQYIFDNLGNLQSITPKRLNVATGRAQPAALGYPAGALDWVFDRTGEPRALRAVGSGMSEMFWRAAPSEPWRSLAKSPTLETPWSPFAVDGADRLYVLARSGDSTSVLKRFDIKKGAPEEMPLVSTPGFDAQPELLFESTEERRLVGVRVDTDAETTVWLDPDRKKLQALVDERFPGRINRITCQECLGDGAILVESFSDRDPGTYSVYRPTTKTWTTIGVARRAVDPRQMATLDLHRVKARDGLDLPVWVTTPRGATAGALPAVVLVHGGPFMRGVHWQWSADAQFLASRGYLVIEPEFRGSMGYGFDHFKAAWKHWGTTMQDDVADAVRWAAAQGKVDPKRVCIAGASYGGYAVLMGAIRYPDLYRCGVAWVAVADPRLLFEESWQNDLSREFQRFSLPTLIGDPVKDADMLKAATPVERAAEIRIPILMAFGSDDVRVPLEHGNRMRAALRSAGNDPEYVVYDSEGHGWLKVENRIDFWSRVEKFLAKNLK
ncbi:MAG TPA: alpha/beta fold hydrolase [Caldimonas sp.]|nr:alpha/beta fold hydrolase [Caldimonas sp.]